MQKIQILVVGKHPDIMQTILRLINNKPEWNGTIAFTAAEALAYSSTITFDIVLLCAGLETFEAEQIKAHFKVPVVQHYGGGSGLLYAEVYQALGG
jgi:PleD family two-component response regulator